MKRVLTIILLLCCLIAGRTIAAPRTGQNPPAKIPLRVLYVGYSPDKPIPADQVYYTLGGNLQEIFRTRMPAFKSFLEKYFTNVTTVDVKDYTIAMSDAVDVTIMDAGPVKIPATFNRPMILMHAMAPLVGMPIGLKFDWYCQCLDNDALNIKTQHEIFNTPIKVNLTLFEGETPSSFFNGFQGKNTPKTMPMWKVVTQGMTTEKKYLIGMVAHGEDFNSPDAEAISGGVCWKNAEAVSIGRHGNFFMWGFSGSPDYMTEEANQVFVNTICYIRKFDKLAPIVKKIQIDTRENIDEIMYRLDENVYNLAIKSRIEGNERLKKAQQELLDKKAKGEVLSKGNEAFLKMPLTNDTQSLEDYIKGYTGEELFKKYGTDMKAYHQYYKDNYEYYYTPTVSNLVIDEDARKLQLSNRKPEILAKCISLLETKKDTALARRVLERYTTEHFKTAAAWRAWFTKNKSKLFYTEVGGFKFLVNNYGKPANAIAPLATGKAAATQSAITQQPTASDPVMVTAKLIPGEQDSAVTIVIHADILRGWHIYGFVDDKSPFIPTETLLELPEGATTDNDWQTPAGIADPAHDGIVTYEGQATFKTKVNCSKLQPGATIKCGLYYQVCDLNKCFPPRKKMITLTYKGIFTPDTTAAK